MTEISRRTVLGAGAASVAVAAFVPTPEAAAAAASRARLYTRARFLKQRSRMFRVTDGTTTWSMKLTKVQDADYAPRGSEQAFALTFRTTTAGPPQGTYTVRRRGFSPTRLFIVPGDARRRTHLVVINGR